MQQNLSIIPGTGHREVYIRAKSIGYFCVFGLFLCLFKYCHGRPFVADRFEMDKSHLLFKHPLDLLISFFWHRDNFVDCLNKIKQLAEVLCLHCKFNFTAGEKVSRILSVLERS